jgi:hypothetical protein
MKRVKPGALKALDIAAMDALVGGMMALVLVGLYAWATKEVTTFSHGTWTKPLVFGIPYRGFVLGGLVGGIVGSIFRPSWGPLVGAIGSIGFWGMLEVKADFPRVALCLALALIYGFVSFCRNMGARPAHPAKDHASDGQTAGGSTTPSTPDNSIEETYRVPIDTPSDMTDPIQSHDPAVRSGAITQLVVMNDSAVIPTLIMMLRDQDQGVRLRAAEGLAWLSDQDFGENREQWEKWWEQQSQGKKDARNVGSIPLTSCPMPSMENGTRPDLPVQDEPHGMSTGEETCQYCQRSIGQQRQTYVVHGKIACEQCDKKLKAGNHPAG